MAYTFRTTQSENYLHERTIRILLALAKATEPGTMEKSIKHCFLQDLPQHVYKRFSNLQSLERKEQATEKIASNIKESAPKSVRPYSLSKNSKDSKTSKMSLEEEIDAAIDLAMKKYKRPPVSTENIGIKPAQSPDSHSNNQLRSRALQYQNLRVDVQSSSSLSFRKTDENNYLASTLPSSTSHYREDDLPILTDEDYQHYVDVRQRQRQPYKSQVYRKIFQPKPNPATKETRENIKNVLLKQFELTTSLNNQLSELKRKASKK